MFKITYFKRLASTNIKARQILKHGTAIVAEEQTKGKGRFHRRWHSSKGGLYLSLALDISNVKELPYLTFVAAISSQKAIKDVCGLVALIKWPNDLIYGKKKLCGILTETVIGGRKLAVVGIGINTNNEIPLSLKSKAVSLSSILDKKIDNKQLLTKLLKNFEKYYLMLKNKGYPRIINEWKKNSFLGCDVAVKTLGKRYSGTAFDVDKNCFLVLKGKNGRKITVREGDVTVL